jgi:hypothetical protein
MITNRAMCLFALLFVLQKAKAKQKTHGTVCYHELQKAKAKQKDKGNELLVLLYAYFR